MTSDRAAIAAGRRAASELQQVDAAFEAVKEAAIRALIQTSSGETDKRDRLIVTCQIIDAVKTALVEVVINGQHAEAALAEEDLLRR